MSRPMNEAHTLAGAYALQSLNDLERRRFERHLARCPDCAEELRELEETTARLALASDRPAPPSLRTKVFAEIEHTRQEPPRTGQLRRIPRLPGPGLLVAAACLVVALVAGGFAVNAQRDAQQASALNREITAIVTAPDAQRTAGQSTATGATSVVTSRSLDKALITTGRLQPLPGSQVYQVWFMGPDTPRPAGTISPGSGDDGARTLVSSGLGNAQQIGVTVEPKGGSRQPTSPLVLGLRIS